MAEAINKNITIVTEVPGIQLNLTMEEAMALRAVLHKVGGYPNRSRRGLINDILDAMKDKVDLEEWSDRPDLIVKDGSLWFKSPQEMNNG